jgi:hypothetical protein
MADGGAEPDRRGRHVHGPRGALGQLDAGLAGEPALGDHHRVPAVRAHLLERGTAAPICPHGITRSIPVTAHTCR